MKRKYVPFKQTAEEIQGKMRKLIKHVLNENLPKECVNLAHLAKWKAEDLISKEPTATWLYANGSWSLARWIVDIEGVPEGFHLSFIFPVGYGKPYLEERRLWTREIADGTIIPIGQRRCLYNKGIVKEIVEK